MDPGRGRAVARRAAGAEAHPGRVDAVGVRPVAAADHHLVTRAHREIGALPRRGVLEAAPRMRDVVGLRGGVAARQRDEQHVSRGRREGVVDVARDAADAHLDRQRHARGGAGQRADLHGQLLQAELARDLRVAEVAVVRDRDAADGDLGRRAQSARGAEVHAEDRQVAAESVLAAARGRAQGIGVEDARRAGRCRRRRRNGAGRRRNRARRCRNRARWRGKRRRRCRGRRRRRIGRGRRTAAACGQCEQQAHAGQLAGAIGPRRRVHPPSLGLPAPRVLSAARVVERRIVTRADPAHNVERETSGNRALSAPRRRPRTARHRRSSADGA